MIETLFFICCVLVIYIYLGYPFIIFLLSLLIERKPEKINYKADVSIIISAYNEENHIEKTIQNKILQNFPNGKIEIIVVSDGSTDNTDKIVENIKSDKIVFIKQKPRKGKTSALNMAIAYASGDIIVFSDANSLYDSNAVTELVNNFSDPRIGYVTGKMIYSNPDGSVVGDGCDTYMRYENFIRTCESRINSIVGVDGGIDALRKELYQELNPDQLPDFVQPLKVIEKGYRVVYEPKAILKEDALTEQSSEYRMRVRVSLRALWALYDMRSLLNPIKFPLFSWQLFSHKVLRYTAWLPLLLILITNSMLFSHGIIFKIIFLLQFLIYAGAVCGWGLQSRKNQSFLTSAPYYFALTNIAAAHALIRFIKKEKTVIWTPRTG